MFALMKAQKSLKLGHVGSKTRSLGEILGKPSVRSGGHISSPIFSKHGQNVCLDEISGECKKGSYSHETWSECLPR